jgi:hypothetical protein
MSRSNQHPKRASRSGRSRSGRPDQNGQPSPIRPDPYDRDRLGRTGSGHAREPSINSQLARRLAGFKGRSSAASKARKAGRGTGQGTGFDRLQRVVVKVHVSRHRPGKVHGSVLRHVSYVGRESASLDGQHGVFYDATQEDLDARQIVQTWEQDRHHFRLIVSAENAGDLPDTNKYIRTVMARVERDLGTPLQWLAVNHYNTDNPHTHILCRGIKQDNTDLVIPRQYVSYGIRRRAEEVATEILGPCSADDIRREQDSQIEAERFTALDRMVERHLESGKIDLHPDKRIGFGADDRTRILGRLQFLQTMDLAKKGKGTWWMLDPEFGFKLRDLGQRNDIIKVLYATLGNQAGYVERLGTRDALAEPILSALVAKGSVDEISDRRFVVVRDCTGRLYYSQVPEDENFRRAQSGSVVELGSKAHRQNVLAREITMVAQNHGGVYTTVDHGAFLAKQRSEVTPDQSAARIRSATAKLVFVAGHNGAGVQQVAENQFRIDAPVFEKFTAARRGQTDLCIVSAYSLDQQVDARAFTWLDSQLTSRLHPSQSGQTPQSSWNGQFAQALERRRQWLVGQGLAEFTGPDQKAITFKVGAMAHLRSVEYRQVLTDIAGEFKRPAVRLPREVTITGRYAGSRELHTGPLAMITTPKKIYVTHQTRLLSSIRVGNTVTLRLDRSGKLALESNSRLPERTLFDHVQNLEPEVHQ